MITINCSFVDWFSKYSFLSECRYVKSNTEVYKHPLQRLYILCSPENDVLVDKHNNILCFEDPSQFKKMVPFRNCRIQQIIVYHLFQMIDSRDDIGVIIKKIKRF